MDFIDLDSYETANWKLKIPKKLYNKIKYHLYTYGNGVGRDYFFDSGIDELMLKEKYYVDFPEPKYLYRFSYEEEANLVTWQARFTKRSISGYKDFMVRYGYTARDVLAAALYYGSEN